MRPLSFTRNLGGFEKAYEAIQNGYSAGVTVKQFRERCGLGSDVSLIVTEFLLATQVHDGDEFILADALTSEVNELVPAAYAVSNTDFQPVGWARQYAAAM